MAFTDVFDSSLVDYSKDFEEKDKRTYFFNFLYDNIDNIIFDYIYQGTIKFDDIIKFDVLHKIDTTHLKNILINEISAGGVDEEMWFEKLDKDEIKKYLGITIPTEDEGWTDEDANAIDKFYEDYYNKIIIKKSYRTKLKKRILERMISDIQAEIKKLED